MIVDRCIRTATLRSSKTGVTVRLEQEFRPNPAKQARGAVSPPQHVQARARAQGLSVSAARPGDRTTQSSLGEAGQGSSGEAVGIARRGNGHHLYSDGTWLCLSGSGGGLVHAACSGLATVDYHGGGLLH